jgi:hypothetical protein
MTSRESIEPVRRVDGVLSRSDRPKAKTFKPGRSMVIVTWRRCDNHHWCALDKVVLSGVFDTGVYIVWYPGRPGRVVCVGQGEITAEIARLRADEDVKRFAARGPLLVTWAPVSARRIDGIERYVADTWPPLIERPRPDAAPIEVNSPAWLRPCV